MSSLARHAAVTALTVLVLCGCQEDSRTPVSPPTLASIGLPPPAIQRVPEIRVAVLRNALSARIGSGNAMARVFGPSGEAKVLAANSSVLVAANASGILIDGVQVVTGTTLRIESASAGEPLRVGAQEAAPKVVVHLAAGGLTIIAHVDMEEYLAGVLAGEVPERWHAEALKAQAIASRSYACYQAKKNTAELYDVDNTVMSQVFRPGARHNPVLDAAVGGTRGLILTDHGALFPAYFHSTCGGHTADVASVFPEQANIGPLKGAPCSFCTASPSYRWKCTLNKEAVTQKLKSSYAPAQNMGLLTGLEFVDASGRNSGRATQVRAHSKGGTVIVPGNQFRLLSGARDLKSLWIEQVADKGDVLEISGRGYGHGVGLCQYGAEGMAAAGHTYPQILGLYYPGADLKKMY